MKLSVRFGALALSLSGLAFAAVAQADDVVRIGGTSNYGPVLPVAAAEELKLFDKVGVKTQFTGFPGGAACMEALAAGEVDMVNFFPPGLALAKRRGVKATIVSADSLTPRGWDVIVKKDSPLKTVKDLAGKKVGISATGSTTDFFGLWAANEAGGPVNRIPVGGPGMVPNLLSGNVDAIVAYPPLSYKMLQAGTGRSLVDFGKVMPANVPDVWMASDEVIAKNPDGVKKTLIALYSAVVYMQAHPDWSISFIQKQTGLPPEIAKQEYDNTIMGLSPDGAIKTEWVEESLKLAKLAGMNDTPPAKDLFTTRFVPVKVVTP
ncbi:ABC transporter substrate-binding protein [Caballeronia telluris]|uniref:Aliphatic sulfonate ABC transporter periplasmic ligand-binding protein n=1 Tax=Caballeronia telluris TaxID=326475 RepID=A0A158K526_9BURK|nr:ABC transporter substrate-binding protein [Caballeronia telluris]SAL76075.1 aliphatic sulfonate ABC transporter periplasmic ligand-binding protein [Caballeronia telluris]